MSTELLLTSGADWQKVDRFGISAGDLVLNNAHQKCFDILVDFAARSFSDHGGRGSCVTYEKVRQNNFNKQYLAASVSYQDNDAILIDSKGDPVMSAWEGDIMSNTVSLMLTLVKRQKRVGKSTPSSASKKCETIQNKNESGRHPVSVLNIGFGLGVVDTAFQTKISASKDFVMGKHVICEAHPEVLKKMDEWILQQHANTDVSIGSGSRAKGTILDGPECGKAGAKIIIVNKPWQVAIEDIIAYGPYDFIYFDTFAENYLDQHVFNRHIPCLLKPSGVYSFFHGVACHSITAYAVASKIAQLNLASLGLSCHFARLLLSASQDEEFNHVGRRYWQWPAILLPFVQHSNKIDIDNALQVSSITSDFLADYRDCSSQGQASKKRKKLEIFYDA